MGWILGLLAVACLSAEPYFIFISGGSASGKTTLAQALVKRFGEERAFAISLDEYLDKRVQPKEDFIDGIPNFDHPSMTNWKLVKKNISLLQRKGAIFTPNYDFQTWMPSGFRKLDWKPIVIIEGIHATNDQLDSIPGLRIFFVIPQEIRYQRRLKRDVEERNYSVEMINKIFYKMAVPYQKIFTDPTQHKAHILIEHHDCKHTVDQIAQVFEENKDSGFETIKLRIKNVE